MCTGKNASLPLGAPSLDELKSQSELTTNFLGIKYIKYIGDPKTGHSNNGTIQLPDFY